MKGILTKIRNVLRNIKFTILTASSTTWVDCTYLLDMTIDVVGAIVCLTLYIIHPVTYVIRLLNTHKNQVRNMSLMCVLNGAHKIIVMAMFWSFWSLLMLFSPQFYQIIIALSKCGKTIEVLDKGWNTDHYEI